MTEKFLPERLNRFADCHWLEAEAGAQVARVIQLTVGCTGIMAQGAGRRGNVVSTLLPAIRSVDRLKDFKHLIPVPHWVDASRVALRWNLPPLRKDKEK